MKGLEQRVLLGLLLGVAVYAGLAMWADIDGVRAAVASFAWAWLGVALLLSLGNYGLRFLRWQYYLVRLGIRLPWRESLLIFLSSFLLTITPGKVGEVIKSYFLKRTRGIAISITAPVVVAERLTDLLALLGLALVGLSTHAYGMGALAVAGGVIAAGLVFLSTPRLALGAIRLAAKLPLVGRIAPKLEAAYGSMRVMLRPRPLLIATALGVLGWGCECLAFGWVVGGFAQASPNTLSATFLYAFTTILGALSFIPGGLGVTEGSMSVGLVQLGLLPSQAEAVAATYLIRLATLWFAVLIGLGAFLLYRRRYLGPAEAGGARSGAAVT